jgi:hypothetical protein
MILHATRLDCKNDKSSNINIDLIDNSPFHLRGSFDGPQDTPYDGGHFEVVRLSRDLCLRLSRNPLISWSLQHAFRTS